LKTRTPCFLVGVSLPYIPYHKAEEYLDELSLLADTAGAAESERTIQRRSSIDPACFIGAGKAKEIADICKEKKISLVLFDDELSPAQVRNLEKIIGVKILDRTGLILDIFAKRAKTREAQVQVSLAQYNYLLPRLTRAWGHLSRQAGGIGTRGVGETQLETDRRVIRARISKLSDEIVDLSERRKVQAGRRDNAFVAALVGYTNVGKSSLMNSLTNSRQFAENKLFATLDTIFRRVHMPNIMQEVLLVDTVGFIRKLPHSLVASFQSTLGEIARSDLAIYVLDVSNPDFEEQAQIVANSLAELGGADLSSITVLNKMDIAPVSFKERALSLFPEAIPVSAKSGYGIKALKFMLAQEVEKSFGGTKLQIPYSKIFEFMKMRKHFTVLKEKYAAEFLEVEIRGRLENIAALKKLIEPF
jgi:GTPase